MSDICNHLEKPISLYHKDVQFQCTVLCSFPRFGQENEDEYALQQQISLKFCFAVQLLLYLYGLLCFNLVCIAFLASASRLYVFVAFFNVACFNACFYGLLKLYSVKHFVNFISMKSAILLLLVVVLVLVVVVVVVVLKSMRKSNLLAIQPANICKQYTFTW